MEKIITANRTIIIDKPFIAEVNNAVRLCSVITYDGVSRELYYEVPQLYKDALCADRSDAFLCALLTLAMEIGYDIVCKAPLSEQLYYQLTFYYLPIISEHQKGMADINIDAELTSERINNVYGVATGASGGVDSFYSILRHKNINLLSRKLTHLVFSSVCTLDNDDDRNRQWFNEKRLQIQEIANDFELPLIPIYSNIHLFYPFPFKTFCYFFAPQYAACALALQNLISIYYQSSGYTLDCFNINTQNSGAYFDLFNLKCLSTENITFYSTGTEKTRLEKVAHIADNSVVQKYISVCQEEVTGTGHVRIGKTNCGKCLKCLRTLSELYSLEKIELFNKSIETEYYLSHTQKELARMTYLNSDAFNDEIIFKLREKNKIKAGFYIWKIIYAPVFFLKPKLRNNKMIRKIYYKFNIDILLEGTRQRTTFELFHSNRYDDSK